MELGHADHRRLAGMQRAADHRLQRLDQLRAGDDGVDALVRHGGMAAVAAHNDLEGAGAGHHRPRHGHHLADRNARPVVQAEHRLDRKRSNRPSSIITAAPPSDSSAGWKMNTAMPSKSGLSAR